MTNILTRIRLKSASPLPEFRIWFAIPQNVESIKELKTLIHKSVISLKTSDFQPSHLMLELEDYELPDESPIGLLRESDVVLRNSHRIKQCITPGSPQKRKQPIPTSSPQRKKRRPSTSSKSSSTSASTSSDGSSSTSQDSHTSSTSGSNSEVSSSFNSNTDSSSKLTPIKKFKSVPHYVETTFKKTCSDISKPPIPPGMGKPSTHSRNRRRKIKRWKQKTRNISQDANENQQGYNSHQAVEESIIHDHLPFFPPHTNILQQCVPSKARDNLPHPLANFIPPSERHDLPSNIFVTSIDVEDMNYWKDHSACEDNFQLEEIPYGTNLDWDTIDENWDTYPKVTSSTLISKGSILGWRAFGLNPSTLTPDVSLLHLGKVLEIDSNGIRLVILSRGMASFGGVILEEGSEEEISRKREDIVLEDWRLIDRS